MRGACVLRSDNEMVMKQVAIALFAAAAVLAKAASRSEATEPGPCTWSFTESPVLRRRDRSGVQGGVEP
jgi:hypothetical protein